MALDSFIPTLWSARILQNLHKSQIYAQPGVINRDYEGEIQNVGDTVKINAIGAVTVGSYTKNTDISAAETLDGAATTLSIDQAKYFNFQVDDIDRVQQMPKMMDEAMREAGYALKDTLDSYLAALWSQVDSDNFIGTDAVPKTDAGTASYPLNYLFQLATILDENNVPTDGRWVVVPPWYKEYLLKDTRFVNPGTGQAEQRLANGMITQAAGFTILQSNNVANTSSDNYKIIAGHPMAWTLAEQIVKVEAYRPQLRFADAVKGLHVYGAKVVRPSAMAVLHIDRP
jgi:hypothetical protein